MSAAITLAACAQPDAAIIERELYGSWRTDAPSYVGRGFALTADSITLHQGRGIDMKYAIERIRRTRRDTHTAYVITYRGVGGSLDFMLEYHAGEEGADVHFPNQPRVIWKRVPVIAARPAR